MGNELAVVKQDRLTGAVEFNNVQLQLLKDTTAAGCDDNEFMLFIELAKAKRLNPFDGQIRPIKRWDSDLGRNKMTVQTGIDGLRCIAARTGEHAGTDDAVYDSEGDERPKWAKVTVYRYGKNGDRNPFTATARWSEYVGKKKGGEPNSMWSGKPYIMLGKCAEALALRKAFPDEMSGLYTNEEMGQADNNQPEARKAPVDMPQAKAIESHVISAGIIRARADGKDGAIWLNLGDDKKLAIPADKTGYHPYNVGDKIDYTAAEKQGKTGIFYVLETIHGYQTNAEDPLPPMEDGPAPEKNPDAMDQAIAEGKFEEKEPIGTLEETRKGTIGEKRRTRLYALMNANKAKTGLTDEILHKILKALPIPVEHVADLELGYWEEFQKIVKGEVDWKQFID